eukprot:CAMPEP_0115559596 /NCGR_PEP_ID=MMETSP0271-20121206/100035_1 /TAXON_ID=71861 /ORGANISM="Scrippsiella trochoidea, Strain CCMP3099" /LENGTH=339 /DNA_ID=CAMNT_0002993647 /DNA_START=108 /DNA_END=1126 /DNA_ORIENTATION=+
MCFPQAWTGNAFTQGYMFPQVGRGAAPTSTALQARPLNDPATFPQAIANTSPGVGLRSLGCAAALLLAACARTGAKRTSSLAKSRRAKIVCAAAGLPCTGIHEKMQEASYPSKVDRIPPSPSLISLDQVAPLMPAPAVSVATLVIAAEPASFASTSPAPTPAATTTRLPRPASFVGGARCSQRRVRRSRSQGAAALRRAARRAVGAQLLAEPRVAPEMPVLSFDPSCLRGPIQSGLQACAGLRSAHSRREATSPAAAKACGLNSGVYVEAIIQIAYTGTKGEQTDDSREHESWAALTIADQQSPQWVFDIKSTSSREPVVHAGFEPVQQVDLSPSFRVA